MPAYRLSRLAEADLLDIATHTLQTWGRDQAIRYVDDLEACCSKLADNPALGRACDHVRHGRLDAIVQHHTARVRRISHRLNADRIKLKRLEFAFDSRTTTSGEILRFPFTSSDSVVRVTPSAAAASVMVKPNGSMQSCSTTLPG
jgi:toxin ParE1/3/4